jgi:hypothetical protein
MYNIISNIPAIKINDINTVNEKKDNSFLYIITITLKNTIQGNSM